VVGTASVRRRALLHHYRPDLRIELLRGNVNTRLAALEAGRYDAIILAMAGLRRLALDVPHTPLDPAVMPPAAAQGALAIQVRGGDDDRARAVAVVIAGLTCERATAEVMAERAMLAHLDGSCHTPIAASATLDDSGVLHLDGMVLRPDGTAAHRDSETAPRQDAVALGRQLGARLLEAAGGRDFLA